MTKNFTGKIGSDTFEDRALFEVAAKEWRAPKTQARKTFGTAPTTGENADLVRAATGTWKAPSRREFAEPQGQEIGATRTLSIGDDLVEAQIWSEAPERGLWLATERGFLWLRKSDGTVHAGLPSSGSYLGATVGEIAA